MANLGDMVVRILADVSDLDKKLGATEAKMKQTATNLQGIGTKLSLAVTLPILGMGIAAVKAAADMEMMEASFTTMLGSAEKAKSLLNDMKSFAAATPFSLNDISNAGKTLLQFGVEAKSIMPTVKAIGDVSGGNASRFQQLSLAFGQATAAGKLMGQDLMQMVNAGFNPLMEISKRTGVSMGELKKQMEAGGISADMLAESFKAASSEGGQFFGGMDRGSKTLTGQISTLGDEVTQLARDFGNVLLPTIKDIVQNLTKFVSSLAEMDDGTRKMVIGIGLAVAAVGPLLIGLAQIPKIMLGATIATKALSVAFTFLSANPVVLAIAAFAALGIAAVSVAKDIKAVKKDLEDKRTFDSTGSLEENIKKLKEFRAEVVHAYAIANENTGKQKALLLANADALAEQYRNMQRLTKAQKDLTDSAVSEKALQEEIRDIRRSMLTTAERAAAVKTDADEKELKRVAAVVAARIEAEKATTAAIDIANIKAVAGLISKEELQEQINKAYVTEIDALLAIGFRTDQVGIGAIRLAKLMSAVVTADIDSKKAVIQSDEDWWDERNKNAADALGDKIILEAKTADKTKKLLEETAKKDKELLQDRLRDTASYASEIQSLFNDVYQIQKDLLDQTTEATLFDIDKRLNAELAANNLLDKSDKELAQAKLDEAILTGDAILIKEAEDALKRIEIISRYEQEAIDAKKIAARAAYDIELKAFNANKAFSLVQIALDTAQAVAKVWGQTGIAGLIAQVAPIAMGIAQIALVLSQVPPAPPALAEGGIVMPRVGGVLANIAEAGSPEVVFPLDKLENFISSGSVNNQFGNEGMLHLQVMLDSKPFLDKIFPATRNGTVLISGRAVV